MPGLRGMPAVMITMSELAVSVYSLVPSTCESRFSIGIASSRSRPFPCGIPSTISTKTTSASSFEAIQWAAVAPTFPAPTTEIFLRISEWLLEEHYVELLHQCHFAFGAGLQCVHIADHVARELAGFHLRGAFH